MSLIEWVGVDAVCEPEMRCRLTNSWGGARGQ